MRLQVEATHKGVHDVHAFEVEALKLEHEERLDEQLRRSEAQAQESNRVRSYLTF